jgi:spermidine synthase
MQTTVSRAPQSATGWLLSVLVPLFFLSGGAGLVYQVLWSRLLGLVFGVTVYAASTVLASFMAGLALGSFLAGRLGDRVRRPLVWFGIAEILIGLTALATPAALDGLQKVYVAVHPSLPAGLGGVTFARFAISFAVLIVPTMLMGASLPLIVKSSLARADSLGQRVGILYGTNTAGAITGTLVGGLFLIPTYGISVSFLVAASANVLVGLIALGVAFVFRHQQVIDAPAAAVPIQASPDTSEHELLLPERTRKLVLAVFVISGFASFALEVIWFRTIILFLRPTVYSFAMMLAMVLAGIAAGSYLVAPFMRRKINWLIVLIVVEAALAVVVLVSYAALAKMQAIVGWATPLLARVMPEYLGPLVAVSFVAIFPSALLLGVAFPIGLRLWAGAAPDVSDRAASRVGVFYSLNVCGSIAGALFAGFVLLPLIGTRASVILIASTILASSFLLLGSLGSIQRRTVGAIVGALSLLFIFSAVKLPDPFRMLLNQLFPNERILWREEGVQATVSIHQQGRHRVMNLDGLHQANNSGGMVYVHRRIGHLAMCLHPEPREALVVGLGGGATAGAVSQHPGVMLEVVELSRSVARGAEYFGDINYNLLQRPNVRLFVDDGRNHLMLSSRKYHVITADIIQPYHAGAGNVYSKEYFTLVRNALRDDGLFLQWIPEVEYKPILRTFMSVFPETTLWADGTLMVGTKRPLELRRRDFEWRLQVPGIAELLEEMGLGSFQALLQHYTAHADEARAFVGEGLVLTDDHPITEYFLSSKREPVELRLLKGNVNRHVRPD